MKRIVLYTLLPLLSVFCKNNPAPTIAPGTGNPAEGGTDVTIDLSKPYQTMESFAASDCWDPNYIGKHWSMAEKEAIARLLFSRSVVNGQPEGIGLSGWRFNLGGGTAQQGAASGITEVSRRAESFMDIRTGSLDWTRQAGQQYFLQKAKDYGVEQFVLFSNTPPVNFTRNGKGYSQMGAYSNLKEEHYGDFANYMTSVLEHFSREKGIRFQYVSPVNEPQHDWADPSQEGTAWQNSEVARLARELNSSLERKGLDTRILLAEAADWNSVYETAGDSSRKNVIYNLFNAASPHYVGGLKHVAPVIAGHSYWTDGNWQNLTRVRSQVNSSATAAGLKVYQTEWSMLGDGYDSNEFVGFEKASYMDIALYMSKVIHTDLVYARAASWSYWTSMATERWGHKNRFFLIRVMPFGGDYGDITQGGTHSPTKTLWVLGNYSLFIRPGFKRVDLQLNGSSHERFGSAYLSPDGKQLVAVYSNLGNTSYDAKAKIMNTQVKSVSTFTTNSTRNLQEDKLSDTAANIRIHPGSVVTVVYDLL